MEKFGGNIPDNLEDMLTLPGVGRKTANLVLGDVFGIPGIVVDTHAKRLSRRIGLTENEDPKKIEFDLMKVVPKSEWGKFCHQLVYHGRAVCNARKPKCDPLNDWWLYSPFLSNYKPALKHRYYTRNLGRSICNSCPCGN